VRELKSKRRRKESIPALESVASFRLRIATSVGAGKRSKLLPWRYAEAGRISLYQGSIHHEAFARPPRGAEVGSIVATEEDHVACWDSQHHTRSGVQVPPAGGQAQSLRAIGSGESSEPAARRPAPDAGFAPPQVSSFAYEAPTSVGPRCRLLVAASSPVTACGGANPASGAGRLAAGSDVSPEPDGSEDLRLPASWRDLDATPGVVLRIPTGTVVFFRDDTADLSSLRRAGEGFIVDRALIKANSSCLSMTLRQELAPLPSTDTGRCAQANRCYRLRSWNALLPPPFAP
jgi:hypothetical protein